MSIKRVWILGAGFSAPLGAPLLNDLFSMKMWRRVCELFPSHLDPEGKMQADAISFPLQLVYMVYHFATGFREGHLFGVPVSPTSAENRFAHAEDFLVQIETMGTKTLQDLIVRTFLHLDVSPKGNEFVEILPHDAKSFLENARRLMALECAAFQVDLERAYEGEQTVEPYIPYRDWGQSLIPEEDVIISFNYDMVVEDIVRPSSGVDIIKLHGSLDVNANGLVRDDEISIGTYITQPGYAPDIKIPGKSKAQMTSVDEATWAEAGEWLKTAPKIIFLGYGLPESDALARQFILRQIWLNTAKSIDIDIVLGLKNDRAERLKSTLAVSQKGMFNRNNYGKRFPTGANSVHIQEMFSQDYMQAYATSILNPAETER